MAQATASVVVEQGAVAQDIAALATALAGEAGIASAVVDPGAQGIVQVDIAATADAGTKTVYNVDTGTHTSGTATLSVDGVPTIVTDGDSAATVEALLEALPNVNAATVTGAGTGASPWNITIDDPVGPHTITLVTIDLAGGTGESADIVTPGVLPDADAGAAAITAAIAAVNNNELFGSIVKVEAPVVTADDDTPTISVNNAVASVSISSVLTGSSEARCELSYVVAGVVTAIPSWVRFQDMGDPVRGSHYNSGKARIIFNENGAVTNGTYVFVVTVTDDNGLVGHETITLTVTNQS